MGKRYEVYVEGAVTRIVLGAGTIILDTEDKDRVLSAGAPELVGGRPRIRSANSSGVAYATMSHVVMRAEKGDRVLCCNTKASDCRKENLVLIPRRAPLANTHVKRVKLGIPSKVYVGVFYNTDRADMELPWSAHLSFNNGKASVLVGYYATEVAAAEGYRKQLELCNAARQENGNA
jgi:hypothetical protein